MIKINLAAKNKFSGGGGGGGTLFTSTKIDFSAGAELLKDATIRKVLIAMIVAYLGWMVVDDQKNELLQKETAKAEEQKKISETLIKKLSRVKDLQETKNVIEEEEKTIKIKLETIKKLIKERNTTAAILQTVVQVIPKNTWLEKLSVEQTTIEIEFKSLDETSATEFLTQLKQNTFFSGLKIVSINKQMVRNEEIISYKVMTQEAKIQ